MSEFILKIQIQGFDEPLYHDFSTPCAACGSREFIIIGFENGDLSGACRCGAFRVFNFKLDRGSK